MSAHGSPLSVPGPPSRKEGGMSGEQLGEGLKKQTMPLAGSHVICENVLKL